MKLTLSVIKADIGSIGGHIQPSAKLLETVREHVATHGKDLLIGTARKNLSSIHDMVDLIDSEREIMPGITAVAAPGHTPGHMALNVSSGGEHLLCISDVVLHPIHLEMPEWHA